MKALSLWEPWASLMACEAKKVETRSWPTNYRGPLLICAAKRKIDAIGLEVLAKAKSAGAARGLFAQEMKYGMAVCVVNLIRCDRIVAFEPCALEHDLGDYTPGRFAWVTNSTRHIWPFAVHGHQGLFDVPDELICYAEGMCKEAEPCRETGQCKHVWEVVPDGLFSTINHIEVRCLICGMFGQKIVETGEIVL